MQKINMSTQLQTQGPVHTGDKIDFNFVAYTVDSVVGDIIDHVEVDFVASVCADFESF